MICSAEMLTHHASCGLTVHVINVINARQTTKVSEIQLTVLCACIPFHHKGKGTVISACR
jgi:hypothetical protein